MQTVDGRELHDFLNGKGAYSDWAKLQIRRADLVQGRDFMVLIKPNALGKRGRPAHEYFFTFNAGKHIGMSWQADPDSMQS